MGNFKRYSVAGFFFAVMILIFILMNPEEQVVIVPTPTFISTETLVPTTIPTVILPTITPPPPVVVVITQNVVVSDGLNNVFCTAIVQANVPVFSQPAANYNLKIGDLWAKRSVEVTGRSNQWARISYSDGAVGYVPSEYVPC